MIFNKIPVVDLFAGPGGLGEGFSSFLSSQKKSGFDVVLSVEYQQDAHKTLELRSFFRKFPDNEAPEEYYQYLRGEINRELLFKLYPVEANQASEEALCLELGKDVETNDIIDSKITEVLKQRSDKKWVLIGGPPCQAYSVVGRARNKGKKDYSLDNDPKSYLYREYLRIIAKYNPAVFVMENVKGILSSKVNGGSIFEKIISDLRCPSRAVSEDSSELSDLDDEYDIYSLVTPDISAEGRNYKPKDFIVESECYGIPQARHRVIIYGVRKDLSYVSPNALSKEKEVVVRDVLDGLPSVRSGLSREKDSLAMWKSRVFETLERRWFNSGITKKHDEKILDHILSALSELEFLNLDRGKEFVEYNVTVRDDLSYWYIDERIGGACNHMSKAHMVTDIHRYLFAASFTEYYGRSPKILDFPTDLLPNHKNAKSGHFNDRFRVQVADKPSSTITSHISKDGHYFIHYDPVQVRSLTVREAARLQTFPDNYFFEGTRTQQYVQVGNAVPPLLARKIASITHNLLCCVS